MQKILLPGFSGPVLPEWVAARLRSGLPGICLYGDNIVSREQLTDLCAAIREANPEAIIALDEEGGDVTRLFYLEGSPYPGAGILGRLDDVRATAALATAIGQELREVGINLNLAPVVDINSEPRNPVIGVRSFGADPELVARHGAVYTEALQRAGVAACAKHFPGHGDTTADSHLALPVVRVDAATLHKRELVPFRAQIAASAAAIMTSHIVVEELDDVPATFSALLITGLLKTELGFGGVVITDALDMAGASGQIGIPAAAVRSLAAGCDLLLTGPAQTEEDLKALEDALAGAVKEQPLLAERYQDALRRLAGLRGQIATAPKNAPAGAVPDDTAIASVFTVSDRAQELMARAQHQGQRLRWVQIGAASNLAIGAVPWGAGAVSRLSAELLKVDTLVEFLALRPREITSQDLVIGYGRGLLLSSEQAQIAAAVRASGGIVVDMAAVEPHPDIDILSYGASAVVSRVLVEFLEHGGQQE